MHGWLILRLFVCLVTLAGPGQAAPERPGFNKRTGLYEPSLDELRKASERGDRAELARWAVRLGPARLGQALRGPDRSLVLAALQATVTLAGGIRLVEAITPLLDGDPRVAEESARALGQLLDGAEPRAVAEWGVPTDVVRRACSGLAGLARKGAAPLDTRLAALEGLAEASAACPGADLSPLLRDGSAEVRRAAALASLHADDQTVLSLREAMSDPDGRVAAAAGVAWCRRSLATRGRSRMPSATRPLRTLVTADATPVEDAAEMLPCLVPGDAGDRRALEEVRRGKPLLRERAAELLDAKAR